MPDSRPGGGESPLRDGGGRHALLMLYLAPFLAGTALADWLSIPVFAGLFALADVARASPALPLARRLLRSGVINLGIVTVVFFLGRSIVWTGLIPQAPIELWLTIGMAAIAALILRRLWANHRTAQTAAAALASLTGRPASAATENQHHAIQFELDHYADRVDTHGLKDNIIEDLIRALVRLDAETEVQAALLSRWREAPMWQAALCVWLADPSVSARGIASEEAADLFFKGMSDPALRLYSVRMALIRADKAGFGPDTAALKATVAAHLAALLPHDAQTRYLRPSLEALDRTLRQQ